MAPWGKIAEEQVAALPRWARVAIAGRCAGHAHHFLKQLWPEAPAEFAAAAKAVLGSAALGQPDPACQEILQAIKGPVDALGMAQERAPGTAAPIPRHAPTRYEAAQAIVAAVRSVGTDSGDPAYQAFHHTWTAALERYDLSRLTMLTEDLDRLRKAAEAERWNDRTPVPQDVFGAPVRQR
jgi:hypothetical protein